MPVGRDDEVKRALHHPYTRVFKRDQDGGPSDSTIGIYNLMEKQGTVDSLELKRCYNLL